jgi:hypothetical protein
MKHMFNGRWRQRLCIGLKAAVLILGLAALYPADARGQTYAPPPDPEEEARIRIGPVSVRPTFVLRDVGVDSNVFNDSGQPQEDFSATTGAKLDVGLRLNRLIATYASTFEYIYFKEFKSERGSNRASTGRVDFLLGRLRPYALASIVDSHERPNSEIDARAHRRETRYGGGAGFLLFAHTSVTASYRRSHASYADDETFAGVLLADALNGEAETITGGIELELTPLTSISFDVEQTKDRFTRSGSRDAETKRYGATVTFQPAALISGRARIAYRDFQPDSNDIPEMKGVAAALSLAYAFRDQMRVAVDLDHDIRYSFADLTPYYLSTAARVTLTQRIHGPVDLQLVGGGDRLRYEPRAGLGPLAHADTLRLVGGGIGYRLGDNSRIAVNIEHTERSSPSQQRRYTRRRIFGSLTYGF